MSDRPAAKSGASPSKPAGRGSPANRFRGAIDEAVAKGAGLDELLLRLTLTDANRLLRDRETPGDIRFEEGIMRFLGVKVQQGGVEVSVLDGAQQEGDG